ncbi:unnamed protein product [Prorocentrum cordatum]|uniref:Aquaporin n=1 Tax=Prorocentrum cordatum TaxID=2364126 RepID=A0ABN9UN53_9DINO|nr:unnamed protein product [Polarella glacialis]
MARKKALIGEFVGTFILMYTVGCNVLSGTAAAGSSIAFSLMVGIYALGKVSGANFNPAVSFALGLVDKLPWVDVAAYSVVQILAGALAGISAHGTFPNHKYELELGPASGFEWWQAGVCELLYTFMLCFAVLNTACSAANANGQFYGLSIGLVIIAGAFGAGAVSGGCFNPAVAFGVYMGGEFVPESLSNVPVYAAFELIGAALAAFLFKQVRPDAFENGEAGAEMKAKVISEILGTYMLVLTVGLNVLAASPAAPFSIAASLMVMVFSLGDVSGAHFNPAVTVSILAIGKIKGKEAVVYMAVQVLAALVAGLTYSMIYNGKGFTLGPNDPFGLPEVAVAEAFFTFVLCFVVISVACSPSAEGKHYSQVYGLAIGACIVVGGFAIGSISGASLNPAVSIATFAIGGFHFGFTSTLYTVFELAGAGVAALIYFQTHEDVECGPAGNSDSDEEEESDFEKPA